MLITPEYCVEKDTRSHTHKFGSRKVREGIATVPILEFDTNAKKKNEKILK